MKVLASIGRWFKAKDEEIANSIESKNEVAFAKQDLAAMSKDLAQVTNSMGEVKATLAGLKRDLADKERMIANHENDARALLEKGREEIAAQLCAQIETLETEAQVYRDSIQQQENMLVTLENKRKQLGDAYRQAESSIKMMQTMDAVARASEKIATVNIGDTSSALCRFEERQKRLQQRLDKAKAINEISAQDSGTSLQSEVNEALGRSKGRSVLERLKASSNK